MTPLALFAVYVNEHAPRHDDSMRWRVPLAIVCGDDDKQITTDGRCPICGTEEWIEAGQMAIRRLR